ncbi:Fur family transcriptional regulator [Amycolatopsis rhabdoformis]|uniref:Fur family transcriptional regulator n=1 Tax=Amycolatopsis rhabdoformis TaxID=1448059 RepID=A0ABZ1IBM9_9PSEU|nr:Fur family transcriptional regulator [Amycolatopsis rhabdoformis]WSE31612.1 Fur family transcriptional regulator [Amycolatopsis rhabdoformis]
MDDFAVQLKRTGLRNTAQRRAVLGAVRDHPHATAAEIAAVVEAGAGGLSRQGLYNVLDDLVGVGLLRALEPAGSPARFEFDRHDNHHHLVCRACGRIEDVACAVGEVPCLDPSSAAGFTIDEAEVTWWGLCAECAAGA